MMAVALGMGDADQGPEREILLHAETGLTGQVPAGDEVPSACRAPFGGARRIDDRLVDALARFGGDAAIAERARYRKRFIAIVRFVDDESAASECSKRRLPKDVTRHRLLDISQSGCNRLQRGITV